MLLVKRFFTFLVLFFFLINVKAEGREIIQFSGLIHDKKLDVPIPFATIYIKHEYRGTITNMEGFFSFAVGTGDTIIVQSLGHKLYEIVLPTEVKKKSYSTKIELDRDTFTLKEVEIYPWPTKQQFRQAFINLEVPDDLVELAKDNFAKANLEDFDQIIPYDGKENFDQYVKEYVNKVYYAGQAAPIQLLNPFAWAEFIKAVKRGDFKKKNK